MTEQRAREIISALLRNVVKARSDINEFFDGFESADGETIERVKADLHPWLFARAEGFIDLLLALDNAIKPLEPMTLYNLMYIVHCSEPTLAIVAALGGWDLPEPDLQWLAGFEQ